MESGYVKYEKSDLCRGYDLGVSCVSCCADSPRCGVFYFVNPEIKSVDSLGSNCFLEPCGNLGDIIFALRWRREGFDEALKEFNEKIKSNASNFKKKIKDKPLEGMMFHEEDLVGITSEGRIGCLLYQYDDHEKGELYRPDICVSYTCSLAKSLSQNKEFDEVMKGFIQEKLEEGDNPRFNSLSLSRMVRLMSLHPYKLEGMGVEISYLDSGYIEMISEENLDKIFQIAIDSKNIRKFRPKLQPEAKPKVSP